MVVGGRVPGLEGKDAGVDSPVGLIGVLLEAKQYQMNHYPTDYNPLVQLLQLLGSLISSLTISSDAMRFQFVY